MTSEDSPRPGRPARLTTEEVVTAAVDLADREGLGGLSMPKLARRLGVGTMTLYGYVDGKDDLLDRLAARLLADLQVPPEGSGGIRFLAYFRGFRRVALEHPALAGLLGTGRITIPAVFDHLETLFGATVADGLTVEQAVRGFYAGLAYTVGFVVWEIPRSRMQAPGDYPAQWATLLADLDPREYPILTGPASEFVGSVASEEQFEWGLAALLRGIAESA